MNFTYWEFPEGSDRLRQDVRQFIRDTWAPESRSGWDVGHSWMGFDRSFTSAVARRGWIGMTWPSEYGGGERPMEERLVVVEELLAAGCPLGAHWVGDRQSGPLLLRIGTPAQKERFLPLIAQGELVFCIGLSEPNSGSDLASLRSSARKIDGGWQLNGRKIWTTYAQHCDYMIGLFRSGDYDSQRKQAGLSQFIIDLKSEGVLVLPIRDLTRESHFNEIVFDDVFVPDEMLVGEEGAGWSQVNAELAYERSGPDRFLSSFPLLPALINALPPELLDDRLTQRRIGACVAKLMTLRSMSLSIFGQLAKGEVPRLEAAVTKLIGTEFEQGLSELVREVTDINPNYSPQNHLESMFAYLTLTSPSFSLRGGTNEIMRGIIAKGLGAW